MTLLAPLAARAVQAVTARRANRFQTALEDPEASQARVLRALVGALAETRYGQAHDITARTRYHEFARRLPIVDYADLKPYVLMMEAGRASVLWPGRPLFWHRTSGSGGPAKTIPISDALRRNFADMAGVWINDLLSRGYRPRRGRIFVSVSPSIDQDYPEDTAYLDDLLRLLIDRFIVAPPALRQMRNAADFRLLLACILLAEKDLEAISIWSPSYLIALIDLMAECRATIAMAFSDGNLELGGVRHPLAPLSPDRLDALMHEPVDWRAIWPGLQLISCWDSGTAAAGAARLRQLFPGTLVQGKGLLATESPITLPLSDAAAPAPWIEGVFLEFREASGRIRRLHEVRDGETYELIISPLGGFVRYDLGDRVRVTGRYRHTACLGFVGRADAVSDLVGEKLPEEFVAQILRSHLDKGYGLLVPTLPAHAAAYYTLLVDDAAPAVGPTVERALQCAYHYRLARSLGQLGPVRLARRNKLRDLVLAMRERSGLRWGHLKDRALIVDVEQAKGLLKELNVHSGPPSSN